MIAVAYTDIGIKRETNQDSMCVKIAKTPMGEVTMAVMCDGMGGLEQGEIASACVISSMETWFERELPKLLAVFSVEKIKKSIDRVIFEQNRRIMRYGEDKRIQLGTTMTLVLIIQDKLIIAQVGDTRAYKISKNIELLTEDQTVIAREIKRGNLTKEQAENDPRKNVLLQCIGASKHVDIDFSVMSYEKNAVYMLCSDGFRHKITNQEILEAFRPKYMLNEAIMKNTARKLVELNKERNETDNISVILLK